MDVVRLDGYTDDEKVFIARRYLLPRQLRAGRARATASCPSTTTRSSAIIRGYTREAGVRSLERELGRLASKAAAKVAVRRGAAGASTGEHLADWLGRVKVVDDVPERTELPGRRHRPRRHRPRRRRAVHRDDGVPDERRGRARADAHRPARRRDEGVGADRPQLRAVARRRARHRAVERPAPLPRPRAGRRGAQGRAVGRRSR